MRTRWLIVFVLLSSFGFTQKTNTQTASLRKADSLYHLAIEAGYREQFALSILYLDSVVQLDPNRAQINFDRAVLKEHVGDTISAIQDYSQQIKLDKKDADAYFLRGVLYYHLKEYALAFADLNKANHLDPGNADAHCYCALAAKNLNKKRQFQRKEEKCRLLTEIN